jgi:protein gp37
MNDIQATDVLELAVDGLFPHPKNPRLTTRQDVVDRIAAQITARGGFDPAHALLVRPRTDGETHEILSGYHRWLAAKQAQVATIPCWVRAMDDEEAYMALLLTNTQRELHPLEEGMHALHSPLSGSAYARLAGVPQGTLKTKIAAARVAASVSSYELTQLQDVWRALDAIHPAPAWLWSALVTKLIAEAWTIEKTREHVKRVHTLEAPPAWVDLETVATNVVAGLLRVSDVPKFAQALERSLARLRKAEEDHERYALGLRERLHAAKPALPSEVETICKSVEAEQQALIDTRRQADLFRTRRDEEITAKINQRKRFISLEDWGTLAMDEQEALLNLPPGEADPSHFNKQDTTFIEWAQFSWNPVVGCEHNCPYCYARDIAEKQDEQSRVIFPVGFQPMIRPSMLLAPRHMRVPKDAATDARFRNVFTCSMADLFGRWVPEAWITAVLREIRTASQWNFLCLTKFPKRITQFELPPNAWMGTTVDLQARVKAAEDAFAHITAGVRWLSLEPLLEPLRFQHLERFDWIVIGGASKSTQTPEWHPPFAWIEDLVRQARDAGCKVYFKTNLLRKRLLELPFDAPILGDEEPLPKAFMYLKMLDEEGHA